MNQPQVYNYVKFKKINKIKKNYLFLNFKLEDNCFTMLCWFLPYINLRGGFDSKEFVTKFWGRSEEA